MRRENRKDDAVSPVIGVMLMLVVTIVIAAVVVMFSTGLAGDTKTTPTAMFEVSGIEIRDMGSSNELAYLNIRHKGGDVIPLSELQITLESIGEQNSGITQILTTTDYKSRVDMSGDGTWEEPFGFMTSDYQAAKPALDNQLAEYKALLEDVGLDSDKYGRVVNEWTQYEDYSTINNHIIENYPDKYNKFSDLTYSISQNYAFMVEEEGWIISENNEVLGMMSGGSAAYPITVLGQGLPTKSTVSTGEIIHVVPFNANDLNSRIYEGSSVKWTISYIPTNSVIAKGEFEVIAD